MAGEQKSKYASELFGATEEPLQQKSKYAQELLSTPEERAAARQQEIDAWNYAGDNDPRMMQTPEQKKREEYRNKLMQQLIEEEDRRREKIQWETEGTATSEDLETPEQRRRRQEAWMNEGSLPPPQNKSESTLARLVRDVYTYNPDDGENTWRMRRNLLDKVEREGGRFDGFWERAKLSIKTTKAGKIGYLADKFGPDNVYPVLDKRGNLDNILVVDEFAKNGVRIIDSGDLELADFADLTGDFLESGPGIATTAIMSHFLTPGGAIVAGAGADVLASAARQGASAALPGDDYPLSSGVDELGKRSAQVVGNVFGGLGGEAVSGLGSAGWRGTKYFPGISPMHRIGRGAAIENVSDSVEELIENSKISTSLKQWAKGGSEKAKKALATGEALGKQFNINFSAGQLTKNPTLLRLEGVLRQLPMSGDIWRAADSQRLRQFGVAYEAMVNHIAKRTTSAHEAGDIMAKLGPIIYDELTTARTKVAGQFFRDAEKLTGTTPTVSLNNFFGAIDDIIAKHSAPGRTSEAAAIAEQAMRIRDELASGQLSRYTGNDIPVRNRDVRIPLQQVQNMMSDYGKRGRGSGSFAKDMDRAESMAISKRLTKALEADVVQHTAMPGAQGKAAELVLQGRRKWAEMTKIIEEADDVILAKAAGYADPSRLNQEKIIRDMLSTSFSPARIAKTMQVMDKHSPDGARKVRGAVLQEMFEEATRGVEDKLVSPKIFANAYRKNEKRLMALFTNDPAGFRVVREIAKSAERLGDNAGMAGSQTAPFWAMFQIITSSATPTGAAKNMMTMFYAKHLSMGLNSPKGRMEMLRLAKPSGNWFTRGLSDATKFGSKQASRGITGAYYSDNENVIQTVNKLRELEARERALFGKDEGEQGYE